MKRKIEYAPGYLKKAKKLADKNPQLRGPYTEALDKVTNDPFDPSLHTHALKGELQGRYAFSLTHSLRITFKFTSDIVHLLDIGTHDEVY